MNIDDVKIETKIKLKTNQTKSTLKNKQIKITKQRSGSSTYSHLQVVEASPRACWPPLARSQLYLPL